MPIVAVFTKFDILVQDELQRLIESVEDEDEDIDEEELERQAEKVAKEKFKKHFQDVLLKKPFPPQAIVTLSNGESPPSALIALGPPFEYNIILHSPCIQ